MSEPKPVELTEAERDALVEELRYDKCEYGCAKTVAESQVDYGLAAVVGRIVAARVAAARREALLEAHATIQRHADEADDITPWRLGWKQGCEHGAAMVRQYVDGVRPFPEPARDEEGG